MKPLSVEMACLLGIQNKIQAVCLALTSLKKNDATALSRKRT